MKSIFFIPIALLFCANALYGQSISMEVPAFAGKTYDFIIFQGSKQETVQQDTIPENGKFMLKIPEQYAPYTGMCRWLITNTAEGGGIDMAIPGHDFAISCLSAQPDKDNIFYTGFDAVYELNRLNERQQIIIDKFETISKALQLYDKKHKLFKSFQKEKAVQIKAYDKFQADLKKNPSFNARFLPIVSLTTGIPSHLTDDYEENASLINAFITKEISFDDLWVSGHWSGIIQSWVQLQVSMVNDKEKFAQNFKIISERIISSTQYTDFVDRVTHYLTQYGKDDFIEAIAETVLASNKVTEFTGNMNVYIKGVVGTQAPDLLVTELVSNIEKPYYKTTMLKSSDFAQNNFDKTLLIFYQTGCGHCEDLFAELQNKYDALNQKGIDIIAIAADDNQEVFESKVKTFQWQRTYCDFQGMGGVNFTNYAVQGTPTMFLIDKTGKIEKKISSLDVLLK